MFPALPSSSVYLLLTKHVGVIHVLQYLFCIHFCQFNLPLALHVFLDNFVRRKYRYLYTFFLLLLPLRHLVIRLSFTLLRFFFCLKLLRRPIWFLLCFKTKLYSDEVFSVALIKDHSLFIRIPWSRRLEFQSFAFFLTRTITFYYPTCLPSRSVCTWVLYVTVRVTSPVFFQFSWDRFLSSRSALPPVSLFPQ